jgi:hypothetical protein
MRLARTPGASPVEEKHMLDEGKRFTRRLLFGMGALASGAAAMSLAGRRAAAKARETADNFPFARTDEADLSADDETCPSAPATSSASARSASPGRTRPP